MSSERTKYFQNCLGVFQGGGCKAIAYAGAYRVAIDRGVSFSEIVGVSSGSIIAVLIAAGVKPNELENIVRKLDFKEFLRPNSKSKKILASFAPKFYHQYRNVKKNLGIYNSSYIETFIEDELRDILGLTRTVKFKDLKIPCSLISADLKTRRPKVWGTATTPDEDVAVAVRTSSNIPIFFQPVKKRYVDGGMLSNLPVYLFKNKQSIHNRVLAFTLDSSRKEKEVDNLKEYLNSLIETALYGNKLIQLSMTDNVHAIEIDTDDVKTTDFESINEDVINSLIGNGESATNRFFNNETGLLKTSITRPDVNKDYMVTNNLIIQSCNESIEEIIVCSASTKWVYELFPTILCWQEFSCKLKILLKENNDNPEHGPYRKRFLQYLGAEIQTVSEIPFEGFIFDGNKTNKAKALIFNRSEREHKTYNSKYYHGDEDYEVINILREKINVNFTSEKKINVIDFKEAKLEDLYKKLRNVKQYSHNDVQFFYRQINIEDLTFMTRYVRGFKYRQIDHLFNVYHKQKIEKFKPIKLILEKGKSTIITPPIIEKHESNHFVLEGNTRLTKLYKQGIRKINVVVVENVSHPLPSSGNFNADEVLITDKESIGRERYPDFEYENFRKIEKAVRNPDTCLK